MKFVLAITAASGVAAWAAAVLAQDAITEEPSLTTIGGIVALATMIAMQLIKTFAHRVPWLRDTPTWILTVIIAAVLTYIAHAMGKLEGDVIELLLSSVGAAAAASGLFSWAVEPTDSPKRKAAQRAAQPKSSEIEP